MLKNLDENSLARSTLQFSSQYCLFDGNRELGNVSGRDADEISHISILNVLFQIERGTHRADAKEMNQTVEFRHVVHWQISALATWKLASVKVFVK